MDPFLDKFHGCLIGLSIGDAMGAPLEFSERDDVCSFTDMENNYLYNMPAGCWTDKTSQSLCVALTIPQKKDFDIEEYLNIYHQFVTDGYLTPFNKPLEINQYMRVTALKIGLILKHKKKMPLYINPEENHQIDCEPIFRIAPVVLVYHMEPNECMKIIEKLVQSTHISKLCVDACKFYANLLIGALMGVSKSRLLSTDFNIMDVTTYGNLKYNRMTHKYLENCTDTILSKSSQQKVICKSTKKHEFIRNLLPPIVNLQKGTYKQKSRQHIFSDNHIAHCLEAALWAFYLTNNFEDGCILAINLGINTNAIGSIYGQLAGLYYGFTQIPQKWVSKLHRFSYLYEVSQNLLTAAIQ